MSYDSNAEQQLDYLHSPVAAAGADAKARFLKKVYSLFFFGIVVFAGVAALTTWYVVKHPEILGSLWIGAIVAWMILSFLMSRMLADPRKGLKVLIIFAVAQGIIFGPLLALAYMSTGSFTIIAQAIILTVLVFGGLTAYVLITKEDFTFLGGFLTIMGMILLGVVIIVLFAGGIGQGSILAKVIPIVFIVFFSLYVLYDTSVIMRKLPEEYAAAGAAMLFLDFAGLLYYIVMLLLSFSGE